MATETTSLDRGSSIKVMVDIVRLPPVEGLLVASGPALFVRVVLKVATLLLVLLGGQGRIRSYRTSLGLFLVVTATTVVIVFPAIVTLVIVLQLPVEVIDVKSVLQL